MNILKALLLIDILKFSDPILFYFNLICRKYLKYMLDKIIEKTLMYLRGDSVQLVGAV
jgi:hypothetical protein